MSGASIPKAAGRYLAGDNGSSIKGSRRTAAAS